MKEIDFFSFGYAPRSLKREWQKSVRTVLKSNEYVGGEIVRNFELEFSKYLNVEHVVGVGNGYDAIYTALKVLNLGKGDLVAVPNHTFIATWLAVDAVGAIPLGIDCDESGLMDLDVLESYSGKLSAVIPVHIHGQMLDMNRLTNWASRMGIKIVEDCAQAHGAEIMGKKAGTWGDFGAFSFYPTKNLGAVGDAGALVTNSLQLAEEARSFINYGTQSGQKYTYRSRGVNSRLDPIQAAVLSTNLNYLNDWNHKRKQIAAIYVSAFSKIGLEFFHVKDNSVFHHFIVFSFQRDLSRKLLKESGINTLVHYPELAAETYTKITNGKAQDFSPKTLRFASNGISLPISQWHKFSDINQVVETINRSRILRSFLTEI
jgi:dTDP-4-amino-4,6-dideoxygalactose transaminase